MKVSEPRNTFNRQRKPKSGFSGSETKGAGGLGSIAEQEVDHKVDVILGGGRARFEQTIGSGPYTGKTVVQQAQELGYRYVTDADGLSTVGSGKPVSSARQVALRRPTPPQWRAAADIITTA